MYGVIPLDAMECHAMPRAGHSAFLALHSIYGVILLRCNLPAHGITWHHIA
jgi:hypothetical protein